MRVRDLLILAVAGWLLAGCGSHAAPESDSNSSGIAGHVHLGPQCPVERQGEPCADEPAAGVRVTVSEQVTGDSSAAGDVVAHTTTDADGAYRVPVAPGDYVVTADAGMSCELMDAHVTAGAYAKADIPCDTGIR